MPSALLNRREPWSDRKGTSDFAGITAIELMVALAAVLLIATVAVPSWNSTLEGKRLIGGAEQLAAFLGAAQVDSVMRNRALTLSYAREEVDQWCFGLIAGTVPCNCTEHDPNDPGFCQVDSAPRILASNDLEHPGILDSLLGDGIATFEPGSGVLADPEDMVEVRLISDRGEYSLSIVLDASGRARICSENSGTQVPGFGLC